MNRHIGTAIAGAVLVAAIGFTSIVGATGTPTYSQRAGYLPAASAVRALAALTKAEDPKAYTPNVARLVKDIDTVATDLLRVGSEAQGYQFRKDTLILRSDVAHLRGDLGMPLGG